MSEEEKIGESREDGKTESPEGELGWETVALTETEIKTMEVHHHPHVEKKSFKEYLLEGLMIFIAVSMGFFAENIRESITEHETVKRNMEIVIENLKMDINDLTFCIKGNQKEIKVFDSIIACKHHSLKDSLQLSKFNNYLGKIIAAFNSFPNKSAFEQMKSSGTLRLIKSKEVLDSLFNYEQINLLLKNNEAPYIEYHKKIIENASNFIDLTEDNKLLNQNISDKELESILGKFYNDCFTLKLISNVYYLPILQTQLSKASNLIKLLQKEYHLENE